MDFSFTQEEEAFRDEVRRCLKSELPPWWQGVVKWDDGTPEGQEFSLDFCRGMGKKGWLAISWPQEYGGQGGSKIKQLIYNEEIAYYRAPRGDPMGLGIIGPTLLVYGTPEQKRRHLPGIARGEIYWCQGYSEPNFGSDLASIQTRAVEDGDDFIIDGEKMWTTSAHTSQWCYLAARTDPTAPKHKGLSYLMVDMKSPGITVRPITNIMGANHFNQIFFDQVRVPRENLIGQKNRGWQMMVTTLDFERVTLAEVIGSARRDLADLVEYARQASPNRQPLANDPLVRNRLADLAVEIEVGRLLSYRTIWMQSRGLIPNYEASMSKMYTDLLLQRTAKVGMWLLGLYGQLEPGSKWAPLGGMMERTYLSSVGSSIAGGTTEIQRNIIALRGLGLPRGP